VEDPISIDSGSFRVPDVTKSLSLSVFDSTRVPILFMTSTESVDEVRDIPERVTPMDSTN
jgi:hypothetical protein